MQKFTDKNLKIILTFIFSYLLICFLYHMYRNISSIMNNSETDQFFCLNIIFLCVIYIYSNIFFIRLVWEQAGERDNNDAHD